MLELYQDPSVRVNDIANEVGVARSTVYWVLEKNGVSPDRIRRPEQSARRAAEERLGELERGLTPEESAVLRSFMFAQQEALGALRERFKMLRAAVRAFDNSDKVGADDVVKAVKLILTDLSIDDLPPPPQP